METIELLQKNQESFTVPELRKMLGIGKTEAYWLIKHKDILTVRINGRLRIIRSSFDEWYKNQVRYRIIDGPEPGEKLREVSYSPQEIAAMLSVSEDRIYRLIADGQLETFKADSWMRVTKESFERWYACQSTYVKVSDRPLAEQRRIAREYGRKQAETRTSSRSSLRARRKTARRWC